MSDKLKFLMMENMTNKLKNTIGILIIAIALSGCAAATQTPPVSTQNPSATQQTSPASTEKTKKESSLPDAEQTHKKYVFQMEAEKFNLYFQYPGEYRITDTDARTTSSLKNRLGGVSIVRTEYLDSLAAAGGDTEGPPEISMVFYENPQKLSALEWVKANDKDFGATTKTAYSTIKINNTEVLTYGSEGLYEEDNYILSNGPFIVLVSSGYSDASEPGRTVVRDILACLELKSK